MHVIDAPVRCGDDVPLVAGELLEGTYYPFGAQMNLAPTESAIE
jgi:hypothetical protein